MFSAVNRLIGQFQPVSADFVARIGNFLTGHLWTVLDLLRVVLMLKSVLVSFAKSSLIYRATLHCLVFLLFRHLFSQFAVDMGSWRYHCSWFDHDKVEFVIAGWYNIDSDIADKIGWFILLAHDDCIEESRVIDGKTDQDARYCHRLPHSPLYKWVRSRLRTSYADPCPQSSRATETHTIRKEKWFDAGPSRN